MWSSKMSGEEGAYYIDMTQALSGLPIIEGFPDVGLVGTIATSYLTSQLNNSIVGHLRIEHIPPVLAVHRAKVYEPCRVYLCSTNGIGKLYVTYSDVPIPPPSMEQVASALLELSSKIGVTKVICVGGIAEPMRLDIDRPQVFVLSNDEDLLNASLATGHTMPFENGFITGIKAALVREANKRGMKILVALAQSHFAYPDPGAAAEIIVFLNKFFNMDVPVDPLLKEAEQLRIRLRDLMRRTARHMSQIPKGLELEQAPGYIR